MAEQPDAEAPEAPEALAARIDAALARIAAAVDRRDARHARLRAEVEAVVGALDGLIAGGEGPRRG